MLYFLLNIEADRADKGGWGGRGRERGQTRGGRTGRSDRGLDGSRTGDWIGPRTRSDRAENGFEQGRK